MEMQSTNEQQNNNSNYQKMDDDDPRTTWYIISIISWIFLIISLWTCYHNSFFFWYSFEKAIDSYLGFNYYPLEMEIYWLNIYVFLLSVVGFAIYLIFTSCKKKQNLYDGMVDTWSKFHFIPLLFISALSIIASNSSIIAGFSTYEERFKKLKTLLIFDLIFTILGLISLIVIYIFTQLNSEWYIVMAIKKGVYSTFIILLWYNFFHIIVSLTSIQYILNSKDIEDLTKTFKNMGISFTIIIGVGSIVFSIIFKDLMASFTNFLIYMGMVISFFNKNKETKDVRKDYFNGNADGILDIIIMALSFACIIFLLIWCKHKLF